MSLFDKIRLREAPFRPSINTGTLLDVATGYFIRGRDGHVILNGGVGLTNGATGRPQMFKTTKSMSYLANAWARCPGSEAIVYDTERTLEKDRIVDMADVPVPENNQIRLSTRAEYQAEDFFDVVRAVAEEKQAHRDDYLVEVPHIDPKTGQPRKILRPTFIAIDSWSKMESRLMTEMLESRLEIKDGDVHSKTSISDSDTNTAYMRDGITKKKILGEMNALAEKAGLYLFFTAHVGEKIEMGYLPSPKSLQHMKQSDKPKGVGSDFLFLMMNLLDCRAAKVLLSDTKDTLYPSKTVKTPAQDLNEVTQVVTRCKGNTSGQQIVSVVSQFEGLLPALSHYHALKSDKYWGMTGSSRSHAPVLMPDATLSRTTVNDRLRGDPQLRRCLEILSQLLFINRNWVLKDPPVDFTIDPQKLADKLISDKITSDVLASRGWWTYDLPGQKNDQPYLSLVDVLRIVDGSWRPKWLPVK